MDTTSKISLTIQLEGSALQRQSEPETIEYVLTKKALYPDVKYKSNEGHQIVKKGITTYHPLIAKPASMHINMTVEAYKYFISNECPTFVQPFIWKKMKPKERLEAHLQRTCEHFNGKSYTYEILES